MMLSTRTVRSHINRVKRSGIRFCINEGLAEQYRNEAEEMGVKVAVTPHPKHTGMCIVWGGCPRPDTIDIAGRVFDVTEQDTGCQQGKQYILRGSRGAVYATMRYPNGRMYLVDHRGHVGPLGNVVLSDESGMLRQI